VPLFGLAIVPGVTIFCVSLNFRVASILRLSHQSNNLVNLFQFIAPTLGFRRPLITMRPSLSGHFSGPVLRSPCPFSPDRTPGAVSPLPFLFYPSLTPAPLVVSLVVVSLYLLPYIRTRHYSPPRHSRGLAHTVSEPGSSSRFFFRLLAQNLPPAPVGPLF